MHTAAALLLAAAVILIVLLVLYVVMESDNNSAPEWLKRLGIRRRAPETFSNFSGPSNPIINMYAARPTFDPRIDLIHPNRPVNPEYSQARLRAEAQRRTCGLDRGPTPGDRITEQKPCGYLMSHPAPCRATERMTTPGSAGDFCAGKSESGWQPCLQGPWFAKASGGETGSPWLGRPLVALKKKRT